MLNLKIWRLMGIGGLLLMSLAGCVSPQTHVADLRCEDRVSPMGIGTARPRLSWQLRSEKRAILQASYRVLVASDLQNLQHDRGDLWDSGEVASDSSINIEYSGEGLKSGEIAYWKVLISQQNGERVESPVGQWEMGLLKDSDWSAQWIDFPEAEARMPGTQPATRIKTKHKDERQEFPPNRPPILRKGFEVDKPVAKARLYATALGLYDCWVNGKRAGNAVLAPDWTDYHQRVRYQAFDVTAELRQGANALAAVLGDGWYCGNVGFIGGHVYGQRPAFLAQLVIDYADGSRQTIGTDSSWKAAVGPILSSDMQDGEDYDARLEIPGWKLGDFDDSGWKAVSLRSERPKLEAQIQPLVRATEELAPVGIRKESPGKYVVDFGQNMVGFARLRASAPAGTKATLRFAEMLNPDGTIYTANLRHARCTDSYVFKGAGVETWEPSFTFHGFRYAEVTGLPQELTPEMITGIVIETDNATSGEWACSDEMLNRLQHNIRWGQRGNFLSVPTDCPQRDERLGWMGDAQVFVRTAAWNFDVRNFFEQWLVEVADAQGADGAYSDVSPGVAAGKGVAGWADAGIICPWTIYRVYGDKRLLERQYDSMARFIDYLEKHSKNYLRPAEGFGDWLSIGADTPKDLIGTAFFAHSADLMRHAAEALGKNSDAAKYRKLFEDVRAAFGRAYLEKDGQIKGHTQTGYVLALNFDLLAESQRPAAVKYLVADIEAKKEHLSTGFLGVGYLLPTLSRYGRTDVAYRLLKQETFPSWLFPVKNGATTIWERWDGWTPEKGFQDPKMNSFNHYSLGSCGEWLFDTISGIRMEGLAFKRFIIRPQIGGGLTWAKAAYESPYGRIESDWKTDSQGVTLAVMVPANTEAEVYVPAAAGAQVTEGNGPAERSAGVSLMRREQGYAVFQVGSGRYVFSASHQ